MLLRSNFLSIILNWPVEARFFVLKTMSWKAHSWLKDLLERLKNI